MGGGEVDGWDPHWAERLGMVSEIGMLLLKPQSGGYQDPPRLIPTQLLCYETSRHG